MAKLTHRELFSFANFKAGTHRKVGHNRAVVHMDYENEEHIVGTLYGHPVFILAKHKSPGWGAYRDLILDHCGHRSVTTRQAMGDFMRAAGIPGGASFAKGSFTARINGCDHKEAANGRIAAQLVDA